MSISLYYECKFIKEVLLYSQQNLILSLLIAMVTFSSPTFAFVDDEDLFFGMSEVVNATHACQDEDGGGLILYSY